jgi:hypothetical protein
MVEMADKYLKEVDRSMGKFVAVWNRRFKTDTGQHRAVALSEDMYRTLEKIKPLLHHLKELDKQGDKYFK